MKWVVKHGTPIIQHTKSFGWMRDYAVFTKNVGIAHYELSTHPLCPEEERQAQILGYVTNWKLYLDTPTGSQDQNAGEIRALFAQLGISL